MGSLPSMMKKTTKIVENFLKDSAALFELDGDKLSLQRLTAFTIGKLLDRLMQLENEERSHKSREMQNGHHSIICTNYYAPDTIVMAI
jgi:hypothetical protein